ncbi:MAG TPA: MerR family transcriptional regulator [Bradyrhizobium sp.]|nr:MerR family transcriptional regulator [Bradyrhizobium sp.]
MVNRVEEMLISEFARAAGLSTDTVRFYVRRGLLVPELGGKGGRNPYQVFTEEHVRDARIIRLAQSLGMSLKEIALLGQEYRAGGMTRERSIEILSGQLSRLEQKARELDALASYLRTKIAWLENGEKGPEPDLADFGQGHLAIECAAETPKRTEAARLHHIAGLRSPARRRGRATPRVRSKSL